MSLPAPPSFRVLNTPLWPTTYEELTRYLYEFSRMERVTAIEFTNTHLTALRRHDSKFYQATQAIDHFVPDGLPLVWCLRALGIDMPDRVYGPTFMRYFAQRCPNDYTNYLLGGTSECGKRLHKYLLENHPNFKIIGSSHGVPVRNGLFEGAADRDQSIIDEINRLQPDFLWVALGTPIQQLWIGSHKCCLKRGVVLGVGFAFDVLAGTKPDAPRWMQKCGLTWLFRLSAEPRRLFTRYLKYNTLFIWYWVWCQRKKVRG